jgi:hypothetical protein
MAHETALAELERRHEKAGTGSANPGSILVAGTCNHLKSHCRPPVRRKGRRWCAQRHLGVNAERTAASLIAFPRSYPSQEFPCGCAKGAKVNLDRSGRLSLCLTKIVYHTKLPVN